MFVMNLGSCDFNSIMDLEDMIGTVVILNEVLPMRNFMNHYCLTEVKTVGRHFTWNNKQDRVFTRIDRVPANPKWHTLYDSAEASY